MKKAFAKGQYHCIVEKKQAKKAHQNNWKQKEHIFTLQRHCTKKPTMNIIMSSEKLEVFLGRSRKITMKKNLSSLLVNIVLKIWAKDIDKEHEIKRTQMRK